MNGPLALLLAFYVCLHAVHSLVLKFLALHGFTTADTLLYRGAGCVAWAALLALARGRRLAPRDPRTQGARFFLAGFALLLLTAAYQYVSATTVAVISRLDTAILIAFGPWIGVAVQPRLRVLAAGVIVALVVMTLPERADSAALAGTGLAFAGTIGVTAGYLFLRSAAATETDETIAFVAGGAIVFYGLAARALGAPSGARSLALVVIALAAGGMMFHIYQLTVALYRRMDIALAEYPTLIAALLVMPAEHALFGARFAPAYVAAVVANVALLGVILALKPRASRGRRAAGERVTEPLARGRVAQELVVPQRQPLAVDGRQP